MRLTFTPGEATCSHSCAPDSRGRTVRRPQVSATRTVLAAARRGVASTSGRAAACDTRLRAAHASEAAPSAAPEDPLADAATLSVQAAAAANGPALNGAAAVAAPVASAAGTNGAPAKAANGAAVTGAAAPAARRQGVGVSVKVENLVKHFQTKEGLYKAVDGADLTIPKNSLVALLGPSGSGKTTLLRMIAGLEEPTSGKIFFDEAEATRMSIRERNIGFVFQNYALFKHMTVAQNIAFGPRVRKQGDTDIDKRVEELLELVELPGLGNRYPPQLSGGQRQRVALARALASNPRILLLDEPFGALDPLVRVSLRRGLKRIVDRIGITTILVTHDQEEAFDIADRVVIFNKGKIEQAGETLDVIRRPLTPFVMNFVGEVNAVPSNCQLVRRMLFQTDCPAVMFRPTEVQLLRSPPPGDRRICPATITDKRHIGWIVKYFLQCDDGVKFEMHVLREEDDERFADVDTLQRVFLKVPPLAFFGFHPREIDTKPLDLV